MIKRVLLVSALVAGSVGLAAIASGDDRRAATDVLDVVERDTAHQAVVAEAVTQAKTALERATRMRAGGDETHARLADGLALDWALVARDLLRAVTVEEEAKAARIDALDAGARVERERALLEEDIARVGRLRAERESLKKSEREPPRTSPLGARPPRAEGGADAGAGALPAAIPTTRRAARGNAIADGGGP